MWDLVPWPRDWTPASCLGSRVLTTGPPGKSHECCRFNTATASLLGMCLVGSRHHDALEYTILHLKFRDFILRLLELVFPFTSPRGFFPNVTCFCDWESSVDLSVKCLQQRMSVNADISSSHFVLPKDTNCLRSFLDWVFTELVISIILIKTTENNILLKCNY